MDDGGAVRAERAGERVAESVRSRRLHRDAEGAGELRGVGLLEVDGEGLAVGVALVLPQDPVAPVVDEEEWRDDVDDLEDKVEEGWEPPPLVVTYRDGQLHLEDGNHRAEGLRRAGETDAWAVISFESAAERDRFLERAGEAAGG